MKKKKLRKSIRLMSLAFLALGESRVGQAKSFEDLKGKMAEHIEKQQKTDLQSKSTTMKRGFFEKKNFKI